MIDYLALALRQHPEQEERRGAAEPLLLPFRSLRSFVRKRMEEKKRTMQKKRIDEEERAGWPVVPGQVGIVQKRTDREGDRREEPVYSVTPVLRERLTAFSADGAVLWTEGIKAEEKRSDEMLSTAEAEQRIRSEEFFDGRLFSGGRSTDLLEQWRLTRQRAELVQHRRRMGAQVFSASEDRERPVLPADPEAFDRAVERDARRYDGAFVPY